jgi:23S rRNA (cytosine1962-C5)-methyltransferase
LLMVMITLRPGRERPLQQRHPWVFSGAIARVAGNPRDGEVVDVVAAGGEWLARGTWSGQSQIRVRLLTWDPDQPVDASLFRNRLARAIAGRSHFATASTSAYRMVYGEADELPGLIVDRYGDFLVVQLLTQGMAIRSAEIVELLVELVQPQGIYERSDAEVREKEGLGPAEGLLWGALPAEQLVVQAAGTTDGPRLLANVREGQKTGFYLDQARNRATVAAYCVGKDLLDCFCYTGGFSVYAAQAGAHSITAVDSSGAALALLRENMALNELHTPLEVVEADVFQLLRRYRAEGRQFDVVVLDPPKFAYSQGQVERAARGYKDINLLAMQILRPGGVLATCSCSGLVSSDLFQKIVFGAAVDARRSAQIIERLTQAPDHPVLLTFPESEYLKGLVCRVW